MFNFIGHRIKTSPVTTGIRPPVKTQHALFSCQTLHFPIIVRECTGKPNHPVTLQGF